MSTRGQMQWRSVLSVVGAFMIVVCIAARWTGIGVGVDGGMPSPWLAALFIIGATLLLIVLVDRLIAVIRGR
jgi:phosphatidylserine synthase